MDLWLRFQNYILSIAGVVAATLAIYAYGRKDGSNATEQKYDKADQEKAREIEDIADRVRRADGNNRTAIERLRVAKKLRDL